MGNRICGGLGRRGAVEERLTRPQRLVRQPSNVDYRKLRRLILSRKLAPCFDALEEPGADLEECPICFFYFPSLNRSRCCAKGICTECFLQLKPSDTTRPAQCPFCKTSSYAVEYRGARSKEEKELDQAEEQKVIEAKMRMQFQKPENVEQAMGLSRICSNLDALTRDVEVSSDVTLLEQFEADRFVAPTVCDSRFVDNWDVNVEEILILEAARQSLQASKIRASKTSTPQRQGYSMSHAASLMCVGDEDDGLRQGRAHSPLDRGETTPLGGHPPPRRPLEGGDGAPFEATAGSNYYGDTMRAMSESSDSSNGDEPGVACQKAYPPFQTRAGADDDVVPLAVTTERSSAASSCSSYLDSTSSSPSGGSPTFSAGEGGIIPQSSSSINGRGFTPTVVECNAAYC